MWILLDGPVDPQFGGARYERDIATTTGQSRSGEQTIYDGHTMTCILCFTVLVVGKELAKTTNFVALHWWTQTLARTTKVGRWGQSLTVHMTCMSPFRLILPVVRLMGPVMDTHRGPLYSKKTQSQYPVRIPNRTKGGICSIFDFVQHTTTRRNKARSARSARTPATSY